MNVFSLTIVVYVLIAVVMIGLILAQRGSGAAAGSGFGAGASATVFGSSGSSNFLSKATKWLAFAFFAMSLGMAWHATRSNTSPVTEAGIGVMSGATKEPAVSTSEIPTQPSTTTDQLQTQGVPLAPAEKTNAEKTIKETEKEDKGGK